MVCSVRVHPASVLPSLPVAMTMCLRSRTRAVHVYLPGDVSRAAALSHV
jgi:hypothetical protein